MMHTCITKKREKKNNIIRQALKKTHTHTQTFDEVDQNTCMNFI
jgi:hypothetical protein